MDEDGREAERSALEQSSMSYSHGGTKKRSNRSRLRPFVAQLPLIVPTPSINTATDGTLIHLQ